MGCHTWFSRPITDEEYSMMKEYAVKEAEEIAPDVTGLETYLVDVVKKSVETGEKCIFGYRWDELGYGSGNPKLVEKFGTSCWEMVVRGKVYVDCCNPNDDDDLKFHDVFRIRNYPRKVIHNRRELRKYLGKRYFKLEEWQKEWVSKFFKAFPGGVITFG